jgi:hypothetical protein
MADVRIAPNVVISDGTTLSQIAAVDASGRLSVSLAASSATVTVDSELPAATALSADGVANPTTSTIAAHNYTYNGTNWDRRRSVIAAQDSTGTGIAAAGILGQFDDASTATVTENQFAPVRISTRRALLIEGVASGTVVPVSLTSTTVTGTVTVDSELSAAAALSDTTANPTTAMVGAAGMLWDGSTNWIRAKSAATLADALANPGAGLSQAQVFLMGYNGTNWDRVRVANTGRLQVDVITGGGGTPANIIVDNNAFTDGTTSIGMAGYIFDETAGTALTENDGAAARIDSKRAQVHVIEDATTRGQRLAVDASGRASVSLTASSATVTVDTEMPAAAALGDAESNATAVPEVGTRLMGYNGSTWDRVRTANTGRLQVDVITGGGSPAAPTAPAPNYNTAASIAAGSTSNHDSTDFGAATKAVYSVIMGASVPMKGELQYVDNGTGTTLAVFFTPAGETETFRPEHPDFWKRTFTANAGFDGFRLIRTNMDASEAADLYSAVMHAG